MNHIFKLVWHRKRTNALLVLEILVSTMVLFAAAALLTTYVGRYRIPLGFDESNLFLIDIDMKQHSDDTWQPEQAARISSILSELRQLPETEHVAGCAPMLFTLGSMTSSMVISGQQYEVKFAEVTDDAQQALNLKLIQGRWFSHEDDGLQSKPIVINRRARDLKFGDEDPIGKEFMPDQGERIIGVVDEFRPRGEFSEPDLFLIQRTVLNSAPPDTAGITARGDTLPNNLDRGDRPPRSLVLKARAGTTAAFEEKAIQTMQKIVLDWSFRIEPAAAAHHRNMIMQLAPVVASSLVSLFLLLMVALGMLGVLWQNITRRTDEIGLRRALGCSRQAVYKQILGEVWVLTGVGIVLASLILIQIPLLNLLESLPWNVFIVAWLISVLVMMALATVSGFYPAYLAAKIQPASALRYD